MATQADESRSALRAVLARRLFVIRDSASRPPEIQPEKPSAASAEPRIDSHSA
jgi:hypothetical protein